MILLNTLILSSDGRHMAPLGQFLHPPDWPAWDQTLDNQGEAAKILGATLVDAEVLKDPALLVVVEHREKAPLVGAARTKVWSTDLGGWQRLDALKVGEQIRLPEVHALGLVPTWARVKKIATVDRPKGIWTGTHGMWGAIKLGGGSYSFATPSGFVRARIDGGAE